VTGDWIRNCYRSKAKEEDPEAIGTVSVCNGEENNAAGNCGRFLFKILDIKRKEATASGNGDTRSRKAGDQW
jgi:hypothetical protein